MIETGSWNTNITLTSSYGFYPAPLPTPHVATIYDTVNSEAGFIIPEVINIVKSVGTVSNEVKATRGVYAKVQMSNAYDVGLLDTIINLINDPTPTVTPTPTMTPTPSLTLL